jgi:5-enolpyruvylshikimate-3-phosphate synthase
MGTKVDNLFIEDAKSINTSFPNFIEKFNTAGGNIL